MSLLKSHQGDLLSKRFRPIIGIWEQDPLPVFKKGSECKQMRPKEYQTRKAKSKKSENNLNPFCAIIIVIGWFYLDEM